MNEEAIKELEKIQMCNALECNDSCAFYQSKEKICKRDIALAAAIKALREQRPHGEWLKPDKGYDSDIYRKCSRCNTHVDCYTEYKNHIIQKKRDFCPNCGADMREVSNYEKK